MNTATIAVAGWGKTEALATAVSREDNPERVLVLTYTETNQREDAFRIAQKMPESKHQPTVMGWKAFELNEIVRPYLPILYPERKLRGMAFKRLNLRNHPKGVQRYLTSDNDAYSEFLGKLSFDLIQKSDKSAIRRLEWQYDAIYIDEGQDLRGNDLQVIKELLKSEIRVHLFLDPRQSTLSTTSQDTKYKTKYASVNIINLYREWEQEGLLQISYKNVTHRCGEKIALLSDLILPDTLNLPPTISKVESRELHNGVYIISKDAIQQYANQHHATLLAVQQSSNYKVPEAINFKKSKGLTRDDVLIVSTNTIENYLLNNTELPSESMCGFYVAVTRARYSVAIAVNDPKAVINKMKENEFRSTLADELLAEDIPIIKHEQVS